MHVNQQALQEAREYHARRDARRRQEREKRRQEHYRRVTAAIQDLAPRYPAVRAVYLFGSLTQPGRYRPGSDIDVAVDCDDVAVESRLWRDLEQSLKMNVDLRPCKGAVAWAVENYGECVYER